MKKQTRMRENCAERKERGMNNKRKRKKDQKVRKI